MKNQIELLNIDLNLTDHSTELKSLKNILKLKIPQKIAAFDNYHVKIPDNDYYNMVDEILEILYQVAEYSKPVFDVTKTIEDKYLMAYKHTPELAKKLWQKHYHELHKPYNDLKNICFDYLDSLEDKYIKVNNKKPIMKDKIII
jgi:hypothetical protein